MSNKVTYCAIGVFPSTMESVAFYELYKTRNFFYTTAEARDRACTAMKIRCKKKNIAVDFKYATSGADTSADA